MRYDLELSDSEMGDIAVDGDVVRLRLSAARVHGADGERGWLSAVVLSLARATLTGDAGQAFGKIADGAVLHDGRRLSRIALPGTLAGDVALTLRLANGSLLAARGQVLSLAIADDARFAEDLSC